MCNCKMGKAKKRGRVGGMPNGPLMDLIAVGAGAIIGKVSDKLLNKIAFVAANPAIKDGIKVIGGGLLAMNSKDRMLQMGAYGLAGQGLVGVAVGIVPAIGAPASLSPYQLGSLAPGANQLLMNDNNSLRGAAYRQAAVAGNDDFKLV